MPTFDDLHALRERLRTVEEAMSAAHAGSSYSIGGRTLTRQDLGELRNEQTRLKREIKQTQAALEGVRDPSVAIATWR